MQFGDFMSISDPYVVGYRFCDIAFGVRCRIAMDEGQIVRHGAVKLGLETTQRRKRDSQKRRPDEIPASSFVFVVFAA